MRSSALCGCLLYVGRHDMIAAYLQHNDNYQSQTHQDTRDDTCHKHISDGNTQIDAYTTNAILGGMTIAMELEVAINAVENAAEKPPALPSRNQDRTQSRYRRRTGAGNRAEEAGYDDTHIRNAAFSVTDTCVNKTDQARRNPPPSP